MVQKPVSQIKFLLNMGPCMRLVSQLVPGQGGILFPKRRDFVSRSQVSCPGPAHFLASRDLNRFIRQF